MNPEPEIPLATLASALDHFGIELPEDQVAKLDAYCHVLWEWNGKMNLTRHDTYEKFVGRDMVDTLATSELIEPGEEVLDVGTGGGVPGIPLAILRPDVQVSLCETMAKKARAVDDIVARLKLPVPVYHERAEKLLEDFRYTTLVVRAVGSITKLLGWFEPHWASIGRLLLIKGPQWVKERGEARHQGRFTSLSLRRRCSYSSPGSDVESVILEIVPKVAGFSDNSDDRD